MGIHCRIIIGITEKERRSVNYVLESGEGIDHGDVGHVGGDLVPLAQHLELPPRQRVEFHLSSEGSRPRIQRRRRLERGGLCVCQNKAFWCKSAETGRCRDYL